MQIGAAVDRFLEAAINEARLGLAEGGIPIGSVLVIGDEIVGRGHNRRVQRKKCDSACRDGLPRECGPAPRARLSPRDVVFHPFALRYVQRHRLAVRHSSGRGGRKPHLPGP